MQVPQIDPIRRRDPEQSTSSTVPTLPISTPLSAVVQGTPMMDRAKRSLRFHWLTAVIVSLILLCLGGMYVIRSKPYYTATSVVYVSPTFPKTLKNDDPETAYPYESYVQQQVHSITQHDVLADAIGSSAAAAWQRPGEPVPAAVARLEQALKVARVETSYQISITLGGQSPEHLADVVNAVTQAYLARARQEEFYGRDERLATLRTARDTLEKELARSLQDQAEVTRELGIAALSSREVSNPFDDQLNRVRVNLATAHQQRIEAEAKLQALKSGNQPNPAPALDAEANAAVAGDPQLTAVKTALGQQRSALMTQAAGLTESNPLRKQAQADIAQIDRGLNEVEGNLRRKAANELEDRTHSNVLRTEIVEAQLQHELQGDLATANSAATRFQLADELKAQIERLQARYTQIDDRIAELNLESNSPGAVHLFSAAIVPFAPEPNKVKLFAPLLFPLALLIGVAAAMLVDHFDSLVYTKEDVERVLGFSAMGSLFADKEVTQLVFDEGVLRLAAAVDHATRVAGVRTFVLTPTDTSGDTAPVLENLAHALAGLGRRIITIDASGNDSPVAYVSVEMNDGKLASHTLAASAQHSMLRPNVPAPNALEKSLPSRLAPLPNFVSDAFQKLTNDYEIVLINTSPLLCSAETEYLARCADVTVLVATAAKTTKAVLLRAARVLERIDVSGVAAIISEVSLTRVNASGKTDVQEFEARIRVANLRWKPKFSPFVIGGAYCNKDAEQTAKPEESFASPV